MRWKFWKPTVGGLIAYHGLQDWWFSTFTRDEREAASDTYRPMGGSRRPLVDGDIQYNSQRKLTFLSGAALWLSKESTRRIAIEFADRAMSELEREPGILDRHFALMNMCKVYYRWREHECGALDKAVGICEKSIILAAQIGGEINGVNVSHHCYGQLITIETKRGNFARAIALSEKARAEGWNGDWDHIITRVEKKQQRVKGG